MATSSTTSPRPLLGTKIGVVTSDKRDKTRTVTVGSSRSTMSRTPPKKATALRSPRAVR